MSKVNHGRAFRWLWALSSVAVLAAVLISALYGFQHRPASAGSTLQGDVNCDGVVNALDALLILQLNANLVASLPCGELGDTNQDGSIGAVDAALVLQFDAGLIDNLGPGVPTSTPVSPSATPIETVAPPGPTPTSSPAGSVYAQNSTWYEDILGAIWVQGEVVNGLSHEVALVQVTADFYSASDVLLTTEFGFACVGTIPAGGDSPYTVLLIDPPPAIDRVELSVTDYFEPPFFALDPPVVGKKTAVTNTYTDFIDYFHVVGTVTNNSSFTYESVTVCSAFYDSAGRIVRTGLVFPQPDTLGPGASGTFDTSVDAEGVDLDSYRLWIDALYAD